MSKYQALIDALAGVDGQLGQPSLHSGHVIYAETEEWCSVDINVKLSANKHISGPLARFIKEAANPSTIRALLADLERAEKALAAIAQQAQEPVAWLYVDTVGERYLCFSRPTGGGVITNLYTTPPSPQPAVPVVSDEQIRKTVESIQDPDTVHAFHNGYYTLTPNELRRTILAMRPAVEPMTPFTPSQRMRLWQNTEKGKSATSLGAFERICRTVEAAHRIGITAKAEDAHQPTKEAEK